MSIWTMLGGPVFWLLIALGVTSVLLFFNRLMALRSAQIDYADFVRGVGNVLAQDNPDEALALCDETPAPVARIVAVAVRHRSGSARVLREAVDTTGRAEVGRFERRLALLAIIAQSAPLLGLRSKPGPSIYHRVQALLGRLPVGGAGARREPRVATIKGSQIAARAKGRGASGAGRAARKPTVTSKGVSIPMGKVKKK